MKVRVTGKLTLQFDRVEIDAPAKLDAFLQSEITGDGNVDDEMLLEFNEFMLEGRGWDQLLEVGLCELEIEKIESAVATEAKSSP